MTVIRRTTISIAVVAVAALVLGVAPAAAKSCARQIIDDWYKDGRVDGTYALHCYDEAIDELPEDVVQYSSAKEDIERALQDALTKGAPTDTPRTTSDDTDRSPVIPPTKPPTSKPPAPPKTTTETTTPRSTDAGDTGTPEAVGETSSDAGSLPLPLIVLSGLALLLLAAGGAGYLNRRLQARRVDGGPSDGEPPAEL